MNRAQKVEYNHKYIRQIIKNSGLTTKAFGEQFGFSYNELLHLRNNNNLPDKSRQHILGEVFPNLMYREPADILNSNRLDGNVLRDARLNKGYTAAELAALVGCHEQTILKNERKKVPTKNRMYDKIAKLLGVEYEGVRYEKLSNEDVWYILTSPKNAQAVAAELNISKSAVSATRSGRYHKKIYAEYKKLKG